MGAWQRCRSRDLPVGAVVIDTSRLVKEKLVDPDFVCAELGLDAGARRQTSGLFICCPWHEDKNPSCSVTTGPSGLLRVRCFGCNAGGDVLTLIAKARGLDVRQQFTQVLAEAARMASAAPAVSNARAAPIGSPLDVEPFDTLAQRLLGLCPIRPFTPGNDYLMRRRVLEPALADGWGCLPERWSELERLARDLTSSAAYAWRSTGLFKEDGMFRFPRNVVLIPWRDADGKIATLQRRVLGDDADKHKYVFPSGRGPRTPYGVADFSGASVDVPLALVEGAFDVLAYRILCARAGRHRIVLGLPGVSAWRAEWAAYGSGRVVHLALDADRAGDEAVGRIREDLHRAGAREVVRKRPIGAKDWAAALVARSS